VRHDVAVNVGATPTAVGNLPVHLTSLVGRRAELEELLSLLETVRLLTLTGPGGSGKTRLALAVAEDAAEELPGGAWWVELADVADSELVGERAVSILGAGQLPARPPAEALALRLRAAPSLLVLDNCEQVAAGCAELIASLLRFAPDLTVLATSRQPLAVPGEQVFRVGGLPVGEGAVELFRERAHRHSRALGDDDRTTAAITAICERLDGMPLAIELAAARTPLLGAQEIAERLRSGSSLLKRDSTEAPARQRSLDAALAWSHRLLTPLEQAVFRRLGVFRGTFGVDAVEAVAAGGAVEHDEVLEALGGLVDQSLVEVSHSGDETRYRLLLTVRRYAEERLGEAGEADVVLERHAAHYAALVAEAQAGLAGPDQLRWLDRLEAEHDNLRAALVSSLGTDAEAAGRLVGPLWPFWYRRGHYQEARRWLEDAVAAMRPMTPSTRATVLAGAGVFAFLQCEYALATARLEEALTLYRELEDERGIAEALQRLGAIAREQGRYDAALGLHEQSVALWRRLDDEAGVGASLDYLGFASWLAGDFARGAELSGQALAIFRSRGEPQETASALINVAASAHYTGDRHLAVELLDEALELSVRGGYQEGIAWALHERAIVAARSHDLARASELLVESLRLHRGLGDRWRMTRVIEDIAGTLLVRAEPTRAARLLGAAEAERERLGAPVPTAERPDHERFLRSLRRTLPAGERAPAWAHGRTMTLDDAAAEASAAARQLYATDAGSRHHLDDLLTGREQDVLKLVSEGRTNREIGAALFISASTAGVHVSNILRKLNVRRRAEAATRAHQLGLLPVAQDAADSSAGSTGSSRVRQATIPPTNE
jgi:predicted ATPase/DNA-binding CsgD family transcriptional regulator